MKTLTKQTLINKGFTIKNITQGMLRLEKTINSLNAKYNFDIDQATTQEQKNYKLAVCIWDSYKANRDTLKAK